MLELQEIYMQAVNAGLKAVSELEVQPMVVIDEDRKFSYFVSDGACGFAWIQIKPANSKFVKYLKEQGIGRKSIYEAGYRIGVSEFNQSLQKKEAYANAFAEVLQKHGINAVSNSRMD